MENMENCLFCKIAHGEIKSHIVWQDEKHMAFLSIYPNTEGVTVVIPKAHYGSYAFDLPDTILIELILASKNVAKLLDQKLDDVGRTALVFEGFGVNHVHAKLFPMHGTKMGAWEKISSTLNTYFDTYPGYISSHDAQREDDETLSKTAKKIVE
jgi:histidine triad (HIT) family protein